MRETHEATPAESVWIASAATASHVVEDAEELRSIQREAPWRVRATAGGEAALLGRWREHLDDCAVLGLWCAPLRVPQLVVDLMRVARERGFTRLVGPLVPEDSVGPYLAAGMGVVGRVVLMRLERPERACGRERAPGGIEIRPAVPGEASSLTAVDAASFDEFWRYDAPSLSRYLKTERAAVATKDEVAVGYTLATVRGSEGSLGRLAVAPAARHGGVGRALACEAVGWLVRNGARAVTLSRQEHNPAALELYRAMGFRDLRGALVVPVSEELRA